MFTDYLFTSEGKTGRIELLSTLRLGGILLRSIDTWLDRLCRKHPRFGIPNLMTILVIGNVIVYVLDMFSTGGFSFSSLLSFAPYAILHGQVWRLVTFVFVPLSSGNLLLLALSLYFYWWIGSTLEREWGTAKFTMFYAIGLVLNILVGLLLYLLIAPSIGGNPLALSSFVTASTTYLNLSMFFAFATLFPDMRVLLFFILPVKIKWLAWVDAAIFAWGILSSLVSVFTTSIVYLADVFIPVVAILNYFLFFWSDIAELAGRTRRRVKHQTSRQTVNFKKAAREAQQHKGYLHKCAVCGKTDTDFPDEEFRYCSQCNGYYCYCSEHIHSHVHIK